MILKSLFSFSVLLKLVYLRQILGRPSCEIPTPGLEVAVWNRCAFNLDPDAWYGISNSELTHDEGVKFCESFGAKLISVTNEDLDKCAFDIIDTFEMYQEPILYSGAYFSVFQEWAWCEAENQCSSIMDYTNWLESSMTNGNCMGGYVAYDDLSSFVSFKYGWVKSKCDEKAAKVMCRLDCNGSTSPTSTTTTTTSSTGMPTTKPLNYDNQMLAYTVYQQPNLYINEIGEAGVREDSESYNIPYSCNEGFPYLAYNKERKVVEVAGTVNVFNSNCANHYFFKSKKFENFDDSMFTPIFRGEIQYVPTIGTVSIGGIEYGNNAKRQLRVITQTTNFPAITKTDNYLSSYVGSAEYDTSSTVYGNIIYTVGGYYRDFRVIFERV